MDCKTARLLMTLDRPGSADVDAAERAALERHLGACPDCGPLAAAERRADACLSRAVKDVRVPETLRGRILTRLAVERRAAFRTRAVAVGRWTAVAAALLLVVGVAAYLVVTHRPAVDLEALRDGEIAKYASPRPEWLPVALGHDFEPPPRFDCVNLSYYGFATLQKKKVPYLVFVRGPARAAVYVVTAKQFDFAKLPDATDTFATQGYRVEVWREGETAYLIIYSGELPTLLIDRAG